MKKSIRKLPHNVLAKLKTIKSNAVVVGCARKFSREEISSGILINLEIKLTSAGIQAPERILPPAKQGIYSNHNINGEIIKRKDLPKETRYRSVETPNYGDPFRGYHTVDLPYEAYPLEFNPPRELELSIRCMNPTPDQAEYIFSFRVEEVLNTKAKNFEKRLFENLNLLQENIGACGVEEADTSINDYVKSLHVSWEILPPGTKEEALQRLFRGRIPSAHQKEVAEDRYDFFKKLKARRLIIGASGLRRYFGALLEDDMVVFENIQYGNAIYILFEDWEELSKKSRIELLSGRFGTEFERIIHQRGWKRQVKACIAAKREERKRSR